MKEENKHLNSTEEDTIDIIALLKEFWRARKIILKITLVFALLGLFVAVFSKNEFTASTTFVPVNQGKSVSGSLGGLASLAGINLGAGSGSSAEISPELYPQIVSSIPFQLALLHTPLTIEGQQELVTYKDYYENVYSPGLLAHLKKYTIGLPGVLLSLVKPDAEEATNNINPQENQIISVSLDDNDLIEQLKEQVTLVVYDKEGFVSISVTLPEAMASAQLALKAQELLQAYALKFKTQKSIEQLTYIEARFLEKQNEYNIVKIELARFQDQNMGINTALGRTKLLQLQSEKDLVFSVYSELAKQLETQRLQVKKDTPLFTVIKPVSVPLEKSKPSRPMIFIIWVFLGGIISVGVVFGKTFFSKMKDKILKD